MAYTKQTWTNDSSKLNAARMGYIEDGIEAAVAADSVTVAATRVVANKLLTADAQPAFNALGDGKMEWGAGGASAPDTNLYRSAADTLKTDDNLHVVGNLTVDGTSSGVTLALVIAMS